MPETARWRAANVLSGAFLFLGSVVFTLWQNSRVAVLWDLSYLLDSAWRFRLGQNPYRDLPFVHAPLTFLVHAALIRFFGRVYYPHILLAALESGIASVIAWRTIVRLLALTNFELRIWAAVLAAPLVFVGIYGIYPHPIYDSDCVLVVLVVLYLLIRAEMSGGRTTAAFAGALSVLPIFFKQNIGLPFLAITVFAVAATACVRRVQRRPIASQLSFICGAFFSACCALLLIHITVGLQNYRYWTITFASQRRLPGLSTMLSVYHQTSLLWTIPAAVAGLLLLRIDSLRPSRILRFVSLLLLAAPFLWTLFALFLTSDSDDRADQLLSLWPHLLLLGLVFAIWSLRPAALKRTPLISLLPLILLVTIHAAFLSQQLWGSTYALWLLLMILTVMMLTQLGRVARPLAFIISATFLICGGLYAVSLERLSYIHLDGPEHASSLPGLRHLTTPGPWVPDFEELVRYANANIPAQDGVLLIPGEDPFFFVTGRTPQFPILLFDPATDPYSPQQTVEQARADNIRWLILKRNLQLNGPPHPQLAEIEQAVQQDFVPYVRLTAYDIYRRK